MNLGKRVAIALGSIQEAINIAVGDADKSLIHLKFHQKNQEIGGIIAWQWDKLTAEEYKLFTELARLINSKTPNPEPVYPEYSDNHQGDTNGHS
jgi:hypothetical protein